MEQWISVRNWRKFQHYDPEKRVPPWIKNHTELMSSDDYLSLTSARRGVLHGIWMEYAAARCALRLDTAELSRRLNVRVTNETLVSLNHAGFIDFVASKTLADGYQAASASRARAPRSREAEAEAEVVREQELATNGSGVRSTETWAKLSDLIPAHLRSNTETDSQSQDEEIPW